MVTLPATTKLYFGPWYRRSPYFEATLRRRLQGLRHLQQDVPAGRVRRSRGRVLGAERRRHAVGRRRRAHGAGQRPRRRPADRHADLPRPDQVRGQAGQVHARDGARRRHRQRPGAAARRRERVVDAARRQRRRPLRDGRASPAPASTPRSPTRTSTRCRCRARTRRRRSRSSSATAIYDLRYYWCDRFEIGDIPVVDQPHRLVGGARVRGEPARRHPRHRAVGRDHGRRRGVRDPADRAQRGPPGRGRASSTGAPT